MAGQSLSVGLIYHNIENSKSGVKKLGVVNEICPSALSYLGIGSKNLINQDVRDFFGSTSPEHEKIKLVYQDFNLESLNHEIKAKNIGGQSVVVNKILVDDRVMIQIVGNNAENRASQDYPISNDITESLSEVHWSVSLPDKEFTYISPSFQHFFDTEINCMPSNSNWWREFIHPDDEFIAKVIERDLEKYGRFEQRHRIITKSGRVKNVISFGRLISGDNEHATRIDGAMKDLTSNYDFDQFKNLLTRAIELSRIGVWEYDVKRKRVYWSKITREIHEAPTTYNPTLEEGLSFYLKGKSSESIKKALDLAISKHKGFDLELQIKTQRQKKLWVKVVGKPQIVNGQCVGVFGSIQDIDSQKQDKNELLKQTQMQEFLVRLSSRFITTSSERVESQIKSSFAELGKLVNVDRVYLFDYNDEKQTTSNTHEWCAEQIEPQIDELQDVPYSLFPEWIETHRKGLPTIIENVQALPTNSGIRAILEPQGIKSLITIPLMNDETCLGFLGFDSVRRYRKYGDDEIRLLTVFVQMLVAVRKKSDLEEQLKKSRTKAEKANLAKSRFLAHMSHELRTPLNAVIGFTDILNKTALNETQKNITNSIQTSGNSLLNIINDILDLSKIEAGKFEIEHIETDFTALLNDIYKMFNEEANRKGLKLILDVQKDSPNTIKVDPMRLRQVLTNLLSNAIKFTKKGTVELAVKYSALTKSKGKFIFSVTDTGIGISKSKQKRLFKAFSQADNSITREYGGTGLGLVISNQIVKRMSSKIEFTSTKNKGSKFYFNLNLDFVDNKAELKSSKVLVFTSSSETELENDLLDTLKFLKIEYELNDIFSVDYNSSAFLKVECIFFLDIKSFNKFISLEEISSKQFDQLSSIVICLNSEEKLANDYLRGSKNKLNFSIIQKPISIQSLTQKVKSLLKKEGQYIGGDAKLEIELNVLIVDDVKVNRTLISSYLKFMPFTVNVKEAVNGIEAVEKVKKHEFDLIFMDIQMPRMDGIEATRIIKNKIQLNNTPYIVAISAEAFEQQRSSAIDAGINTFLVKPVTLKSFTEKMQEVTNDLKNR